MLVLIQWDNSRLFELFRGIIYDISLWFLDLVDASKDIHAGLLTVYDFLESPLPTAASQTINKTLMLDVQDASYFFTSLYILSAIVFAGLALISERVRAAGYFFLLPNVIVNVVILTPVYALFLMFFVHDNFLKATIMTIVLGYLLYEFGGLLFKTYTVPLSYMSILAATTPLFALWSFIRPDSSD